MRADWEIGPSARVIAFVAALVMPAVLIYVTSSFAETFAVWAMPWAIWLHRQHLNVLGWMVPMLVILPVSVAAARRARAKRAAEGASRAVHPLPLRFGQE